MYDKNTFLSGLTMGLCGKGVPGFDATDTFGKGYLLGCELRNGRPTAEPVAWLYNGVQLPKLPEWDDKTYPYAYITAFVGWAGLDYMLSCTSKAVYLYADADGKIRSSGYPGEGIEYHYKRGEGVGWVLQDGNPLYDLIHYPANIINLLWSNTDVLGTDGKTVYLEVSEPVPTYESGWWETVVEETKTTDSIDGYNGARCMLTVSLSVGTAYRLTVNGESKEWVCESDTSGNDILGNKWLAQSGNSTYEDSGYDYCVVNPLWSYFFSRNPGTYTVKIERWEPYVL